MCSEENCGQEFSSSLHGFLYMKKCPYCDGREPSENYSLASQNPKLTKEWHESKNGDLTPEKVTPGSGKFVWWRCSKNSKHEWISRISQRKSNDSCPFCAGKYPSEDYNFKVAYPDLSKKWNYKKNKNKPEDFVPHTNVKAWWICEKGHEWERSINGMTHWNGCPQCKTSKGEDAIKAFLEKLKINFSQQKTFSDLKGISNGFLSYDFFLSDDNILIEYQGEQHEKAKSFGKSRTTDYEEKFRIQQEHDSRKREYAQQNKIRLLEIWYYDFDRIEEILSEFLLKEVV
jgi:hypothetical protein